MKTGNIAKDKRVHLSVQEPIKTSTYCAIFYRGLEPISIDDVRKVTCKMCIRKYKVFHQEIT